MRLLWQGWSNYQRLPVSGKLLALPLILFLSLWTAATLGFIVFSNYTLESIAREDTKDLAISIQQALQQKKELLSLAVQLSSLDNDIADTVSTGNHILVQQALLPIQSVLEKNALEQDALEVDFISIVDRRGNVLHSWPVDSQERSVLLDNDIYTLAGDYSSPGIILPPGNVASPMLASIHPIQSSTETLAHFVIGIDIDESFLQSIKGDTAIHLIAFQDDQLIASSLASDPSSIQRLPRPNESPTWIEIEGETYVVKTIKPFERMDNQLSIAVLRSIQEVENAQQKVFLIVGGFGFLGSALIIGMSFLGVRVTQSLSHRLHKLNQATKKLAQGSLTTRITNEGEDEVGALAKSFNKMAQQLTIRDQKLAQQVKQLKSVLKELHQTQGQLVQDEKMLALGQMTAGIAHEINNPINFIYANLEPLKEYFQDLIKLIEAYQAEYPQATEKIRLIERQIDLDYILKDSSQLLGSMNMGTQRVQDIVLALRNYSRLDESNVKQVDIHEGIESTLLILNHRLKDGVEVIKQYGDLPKITCSPAQINQVYTNIMVNALDALFEADCNPKQLVITTRETASDYIQISFRDNGMGISDENKARIFEPFFTTKDVGKGTGLGLGICYKIIQSHHGTIEVKSVVGQGTEFIIQLPKFLELHSLS